MADSHPGPGGAHTGTFAPWGATTGVGSLPHSRADDALRLVADTCPEVPYWPQLPQAGPLEFPVLQPLAPVADLLRAGAEGLQVIPGCEDDFVFRLDHGPAGLPSSAGLGLRAFLAARADGRFRHARAVKGQISGPATVAGLLRVGDRPALLQPDLLESLAGFLARQARWQVELLGQNDQPVLLVVDEPGLAVAEEIVSDHEAVHSALSTVLAAAQDGGALAGLHRCGATSRTIMFPAAPEPETAAADAARGVPAQGRLTAWNIVPVHGGPPIAQLVNDAVGRLSTGTDDTAGPRGEGARQALARSLFTPACGLALVTPEEAARTSRTAQAAAAQVRRHIIDRLPTTY